MVKRKIVKIDEEKCNGCGECVPNCQEGALQMIDGKARLISDLFCDGLGACIGHCPQGAITIEEREADKYDERKVMGENIVPKGKNTIKVHIKHLKDHGATKYYDEAVDYLKEEGIEIDLEGDNMKDNLPCGCPGTAMREIKPKDVSENTEQASALRQWPVQLSLLPVQAPFFDGSHLLVAADCVGFANPNFHSKLLNGKAIVIGCPKLDDIKVYEEKLTEIFKQNRIKSVTVAIMEVPCCSGMHVAVKNAIKASGKDIPLIKEVVGINGEIK